MIDFIQGTAEINKLFITTQNLVEKNIQRVVNCCLDVK